LLSSKPGNQLQNQIKPTLSEPESISYVRGLLESNALAHRSDLAARIGGYLARNNDPPPGHQLYLARNNDPPPGHQLLWQGYAEFQFMCIGFALLEEE